MAHQPPLFFALKGSAQLGARIADRFGFSLGEHEEREFPDGEHKIRPLTSVDGRRVVVIHSLYSDSRQSVNDKLCRLLFFIGALRDAGAESISAVVPYMAYARKDRRSKPHDPVTTRYVANFFAAVRVDRVITLGVHNPAAQENAFQCVYLDLDAAPLFAEHFAQSLGQSPVTVLAPDTGAVKNGQRLQQELQRRGLDVELAFMTKLRSQDIVTSSPLFGKVDGRTVIIYDDLISSGTTIANGIELCRGRSNNVCVAAVHGVFSAEAEKLLRFDTLREVVVSDSVLSDRIDRAAWGDRLRYLDSSTVFADCLNLSVEQV